MKATPLSNCERRFLLRAIQEKKVHPPFPAPFPKPFPIPFSAGCSRDPSRPRGPIACRAWRTNPLHMCVRVRVRVFPQRLDGRQCYDYRNIRVSFGADRGCCMVELGRTRWAPGPDGASGSRASRRDLCKQRLAFHGLKVVVFQE